MKRPKQHQIDADAQKLFNLIISSEHSVRPQPIDDYGIDYEIEIFKDEQSTGFIFKVQLKGTEKPNYLNDGNQISFRGFEFEKAKYLIEEIEIPAVLVLVDTISKKIFWVAVQSNQSLIETFKKAKETKQHTITIQVSTKNQLPDTWGELLAEMEKCAYLMALKRASRVPSKLYSEHIEYIDNIDQELLQLHKKIDISINHKLVSLIEDDKITHAKTLINELMENPERSVELKFNAILLTEQVFIRENRGNIDSLEKAKFDLWRANELTELCEINDAGEYLHHIAYGYSLSAKLFYLTITDFQLYVNRQIHQSDLSTTDSFEQFWFNMLTVERTKIANHLAETITKLESYLSELISQNHWEFFPDISTNISWSLLIFLVRLQGEKLIKEAEEFETWLVSLIDFTFTISNRLKSTKQLGAIQNRLFTIYIRLIDISEHHPDKVSIYKDKAKDVIKSVKDKNVRTRYEQQLKQFLSENKSADKVQTLDWDTIEHHYRQQARALFNVDFSLLDDEIDESDKRYRDAQLAWIIDLGIRDLNPTRILEKCQHLIYRYWEQGGIGTPAQILRLYSARMKRMGCIKHPEHTTPIAYSLDDLYSNFHEDFCKKCQDCLPQQQDWSYSEDWHKEQIKKMGHSGTRISKYSEFRTRINHKVFAFQHRNYHLRIN